VGEPDLSPRLRDALEALDAGQVTLADLREVLRESEVVVPKPAGALGGRDVSLPVIEAGGEQAVPLFSSLETLAAAAPEGASYVAVAFESLLPGWPDQLGAVFDPGQGWALHVPAHAMKEPAPIVAPAGSRAIVGEPAVEPEQLLAQLRRQLPQEPAVQAAWRALVLLDGPGEIPHVAVGLRLASGADEQVLSRVGRMAAAAASDGPLDIIVVEPASGDPVADYMLAQAPFYRRDAG
jgi:SseB protein C-terminal domain/SseB protein N-terminal domain